MSVFGLDLGNATSVVAIARRGGVDVCINEVSKRTTPACVAFGPGERHIGEAGATLRGRAPQNTIAEVKQLLGKKWANPTVARECARHPNRIVGGEAGEVRFEAAYGYRGEESTGEESFTAPEVAAMLLTNLKSIAATENGGAVKDCVIAVPPYFTDAQRRALLDAAEIAGVNVLRLIDETSAAALQYGIPKSNDFSETEPTYVVFYDLGHSSLNVCVAEFRRGKVSIRATSSDLIGGRDFDQVLFDHFAARFLEKTKCDVSKNPRAVLRLLAAVEKTKKVLSANPEAPCNVESLMDDRDFSDKISRDEFLELASSLKDRLLAPVHAALAEAGITAESVATCELMGGSTRMPVVIKSLESVFGREPSRTLNQDECIARGAAFVAAMLSPAFRVRDFAIEDAVPYGISVHWEPTGNAVSDKADDGKTSTEVVKRGATVPKTTALTFRRAEDFTIRAQYTDTSILPEGTDPLIGTFRITGVRPTEAGEPANVRVKVRFDVNGVFDVISANIVETYTVTEEVEVKSEKSDKKDKKSEDAEGKEGGKTEEGGGDAATEEGAAKDAEAKDEMDGVTKELVTKTKTRQVPLAIEAQTSSMSRASLNAAIERENEMAAADKLVRDTADRRNAVESYVYEMRDRISEGGALHAFTPADVRESFVSTLGDVEDWLYGDGEDATKSVYASKLAELQAVGDPITKRYEESVRRPAAFKALLDACREYKLQATSRDAKYEHIPAEDRAKVENECAKTQAWGNETQGSLSAAPKDQDPKVTVAMIENRTSDLIASCRPTMTRPKPKVATTPIVPEAEAAKPEAAKPEEAAEETAADAKADAGDAKEEPAQMDLD
jgi:heat shock protein 4